MQLFQKKFETNKVGEVVDFKQINAENETPLIYILKNNIHSKFTVTKLNIIIKNSELFHKDNNGQTAFDIALLKNLEELHASNWNFLIKNTNISNINEEKSKKIKEIESFLEDYNLLHADLRGIPHYIKKDKNFLLKKITKGSHFNFELIPKELKYDIDIVTNAIKFNSNYNILKLTSKKIKNNPEIVLLSYEKNKSSINYASEEIQNFCKQNNNVSVIDNLKLLIYKNKNKELLKKIHLTDNTTLNKKLKL